MPLRLFFNVLIFMGILITQFHCREAQEEIHGPLKEEAKIVEKNIALITETTDELKKAEKMNLLQDQLDLKRKLDGLIFDINLALKKCSEKYITGRNIPFKQIKRDGEFEVKEVRLIGCRFNQEPMAVEIQLMAEVKINTTKNDFLSAQLLNENGKYLDEIKFLFTNDYPAEGKIVTLFTHPRNFNVIKTFARILFN